MNDLKLTFLGAIINRVYDQFDNEEVIANIFKKVNKDLAKYPRLNFELFEHLLDLYDHYFESLKTGRVW